MLVRLKLKTPHKNTKAVTRIIDYLNVIRVKITVHHGEYHKYLGMTFYFSTPVEVKVSMIWNVKDILDNFSQ